jgi:flagellar biosynthetic protein FliQ
MNESDIVDIAREAIMVMMKVGGPILIVGLVVGVMVSLFQTVTQIQEPTLSFVPKLALVALALLVLLPFMLATLNTFTISLTDRIAAIGRPPASGTDGT